MESQHQKIKTLIRRETHLNSNLTYHNYLKKRFRILPKLSIALKNTTKEPNYYKTQQTQKKLFKVVKNLKLVRKFDLRKVMFSNLEFDPTMLLYIGKKISSIGVSCLLINEFRDSRSQHKRIVTSWPKYMKNLRSLCYRISIEKTKVQKRISVATDFLRYLPKVKAVKVKFQHMTERTTQLNGLWEFEKYPVSIEKLWLKGKTYEKKIFNSSLTHLKNLKELRMDFVYLENSVIKAVYDQISQLTKLEVLSMEFDGNVKIDDSVCLGLGQLKKLKNVKIGFSTLTFSNCPRKTNNLRILKSLEDCPLEKFQLKIVIESVEEILPIRDFLAKKKELKRLKLWINKYSYEGFENIEELLKTIDKDLPQLTHLSFFARDNMITYNKNEKIPERDFPLKNIFMKVIPLKKFKMVLNPLVLSKKGYLSLLESINGIASTLERLEIDTGEYKFKESLETDIIINLIKNLSNIRSLKLDGLDISLRAFFVEFVEAILGLKYLTKLKIREVSGKVTKPSIIDGIEKILSKKGLEIFYCRVSADFEKFRSKTTRRSMNLKEVKWKNPFLKKYPRLPIYDGQNDNDDDNW